MRATARHDEGASPITEGFFAALGAVSCFYGVRDNNSYRLFAISGLCFAIAKKAEDSRFKAGLRISKPPSKTLRITSLFVRVFGLIGALVGIKRRNPWMATVSVLTALFANKIGFPGRTKGNYEDLSEEERGRLQRDVIASGGVDGDELPETTDGTSPVLPPPQQQQHHHHNHTTVFVVPSSAPSSAPPSSTAVHPYYTDSSDQKTHKPKEETMDRLQQFDGRGQKLDPSKTTAGRPRRMSDSPERTVVDYEHAGLPPVQMNVGGYGIPVPAQGQQYLRNASNMPQQYPPPSIAFTASFQVTNPGGHLRNPPIDYGSVGASTVPTTTATRQRDMSPPTRGPISTTANRSREMSPARDSHGRPIQTDTAHGGIPAGLTGSRDPNATANRPRAMD